MWVWAGPMAGMCRRRRLCSWVLWACMLLWSCNGLVLEADLQDECGGWGVVEDAVEGEGAAHMERGECGVHGEVTRHFEKPPQLLLQAERRSTQHGNYQVIRELLQHLHVVAALLLCCCCEATAAKTTSLEGANQHCCYTSQDRDSKNGTKNVVNTAPVRPTKNQLLQSDHELREHRSHMPGLDTNTSFKLAALASLPRPSEPCGEAWGVRRSF